MKNKRALLALASLASASAVLIFYPAAIALFHRWEEPISYFDHAIFVPFICVWMVHRERELHRSSKTNHFTTTSHPLSYRLGFLLLLFALLLQLAGAVQEITFAQGTALVLAIWAATLIFGGNALFRRFRWSLLYSLLLIPIPTFFMAQMTLGMRQLATTLAADTLHFAMFVTGQSFARVGNELHFSGHRVTIVDACSGMNTLMTVIAVGLILVYLEKSKTIAWLTSALLIPVAILANLIRILTICAFVAIDQGDFAFGVGHVPIGIFTVGAAFYILAFRIRLPKKWETRLNAKWNRESIPTSSQSSLLNSERSLNSGKLFKQRLQVFTLIFVAVGLFSLRSSNHPREISTSVHSDPMPQKTTESWSAKDLPLDAATYDIVGTSDAHMFQYNSIAHASTEKPVYLYWLRSNNSRKIGHPPELCYRGDNYEITERAETQIQVHGHSIPVIRLVARQGDYQLLVYYWYRIGGVETASYLGHQLQWAWMQIKSLGLSTADAAAGGNEASMTRISTEVDDHADQRLQKWMKEEKL